MYLELETIIKCLLRSYFYKYCEKIVNFSFSQCIFNTEKIAHLPYF